MRPIVVALCVVLALALAGCGDDSPSSPTARATTSALDAAYSAQLTRIDDDLNVAMQGLFGDRQMTDAEISTARTALEVAAGRLAALKPPQNVRKYHEQYARGVKGFGPIIDKLAAARGDAAIIQQHLRDPAYTEVIQDLESAKKGFGDRGYRL